MKNPLAALRRRIRRKTKPKGLTSARVKKPRIKAAGLLKRFGKTKGGF
jgi:hypothetical protein